MARSISSIGMAPTPQFSIAVQIRGRSPSARMLRRLTPLPLRAILPSASSFGESLERNQVDGSAKKTNVLGIQIEAWQVGHDMLGHLASSDRRTTLYGI